MFAYSFLAMTSYNILAQITAYLSLGGFIVQVALVSRIYQSAGIGVALLLLPVGFSASAAIILFTGALWAVAGARVLGSTMRYTLDKTTREILFVPLPTELRHRVKPFIDVTAEIRGSATRPPGRWRPRPEPTTVPGRVADCPPSSSSSA